MEEKITKIKFLNFMTKDLPERKAGQFEGIVVCFLVMLSVGLFLSLLNWIL